MMKKTRQHNEFGLARIIGALIFALLLLGLVVFTFTYDPEKQFSSSFFEDVSDAVQWRQ